MNLGWLFEHNWRRYALLSILTLCISSAEPSAFFSPEVYPSSLPMIEKTLQSKDPALDLYRSAATRPLVKDFFNQLTGSSSVTWAILKNCDTFDVPVIFAFSLAWVESEFNTRAYRRNTQSADRGLFQLNSASFPNLSTEDCFDPMLNARYGIAYIKECMNGSPSDAVSLANYNAGQHRVSTQGAPRATLIYIERFWEYRDQLRASFVRYMREECGLTSL